MNRAVSGCLVLVLLGLTGCNQGSPGGPGVVNPAAKPPPYGQANDTFNLSVPILPTVLKQGETRVVTIGIQRGKNFHQDVQLRVADVSPGLTLRPTDARIRHGDKETKLTLKATSDAALGDFTFKLTGHPTEGPDALTVLKVTVQKM